jgi:hypothetical protein
MQYYMHGVDGVYLIVLCCKWFLLVFETTFLGSTIIMFPAVSSTLNAELMLSDGRNCVKQAETTGN